VIRKDRGPSPQEGTMWSTGIDRHREFCVVTTYGPEGPRVKQARGASTALALAPYFAEFPGPRSWSSFDGQNSVLARWFT